MYDANRVLRRLRLYASCYDYDFLLIFVLLKLHCNLQLIDKIEDIGHIDANT